MTETKQYIEAFLAQNKITVEKNRINLFDEFTLNESNIKAVKQIIENQQIIMKGWKLKLKINDIIDKPLIIPNATFNKPYEASLDFIKLGMNDIVYTEFVGLEEYGLEYDNQTETIKGNPAQSGDFKIKMKFRVEGEDENSILNEKLITLIINADPKSLWKDIPSTQSEDNYWKPDNINDFQPLGDKHIVVASKRGRSHANVGSFRDDDFSFKHFASSGWSIICVADGAGSAVLSRQGSKMACEGIIEYFTNNFNEDLQKQINEIIENYNTLSKDAEIASEVPDQTEIIKEKTKEGIKDNAITESVNIINETSNEETPKLTFQGVQKELKLFLYNNLGKAAFAVHKEIEVFAKSNEKVIKDFHSTLIFALYKKYEFGYAILSFGVGDCPIGLINKDCTEINLMNWLDVGEFGGGTRFITMPEIFSSDKFQTRFGFKLIDDFSYLMLMTDGIYDPKFIVEANLEKIEKWKEFLEDLGGNNDEKIKVEFNSENKEIKSQLSDWMDFWSPGNHDDRTLAIVF